MKNVPSTTQNQRNELLFRAFKEAIQEVSKNTTIEGLIIKLRQCGLSKLQLMVVDSSVKEMPLNTLNKTLLIKEDDYLNLVLDATIKIANSVQDETPDVVDLDDLQ